MQELALAVPRRLRVIRWAHVISPNSERLPAACREESVNGRSARLGGSRVVLAFCGAGPHRRQAYRRAAHDARERTEPHARPLVQQRKDLSNKLR